MALRVSPVWWPFVAAASPLLVPWLAVRNRRFQADRARADRQNQERIGRAESLPLPALDFLDLIVLVEAKTRPGFIGDAAVSYWLKTPLGSLLYDVGLGPASPALSRNAKRLGFDPERLEALTISHLHFDHMGGLAAQRSRRVALPVELINPAPIPCYLPDRAGADGFQAQVVEAPQSLAAGIASTGPLARSLFLLGYTEEQALVARVRGKGLVVITGCGHPGIQMILQMVSRLSAEPIHAIVGGLHLPVTGSRGHRAGVQLQTIFGTGKPPWQRIGDRDLDRTVAAINRAAPRRVCLSAHDTCEHALDRLANELDAQTEVLEAGATYRF